MNNLQSNLLNVGDVLKINKTVASPESLVYTVKQGDSLSKIASLYNVSVEQLKTSNNLTGDLIVVGQVLNIPKSEVSDEYEKYIVKSKDNLYSIANKFDTTVNEIKQLNSLNTNILQIGQELLIPNSQNYVNYKVQKADTLYGISKKYNTTVDEIKKLNNLNSNTLSINQVIKIPK